MTTGANMESGGPPSLLPETPRRGPNPAEIADADNSGFKPAPGSQPPVQRQGAQQPAPAVDPATGQPAEPPPYDHPFLETYAKGKYRTFDDFGKHMEGVTKEMKQSQTKAQALEMRLGQWKGPPVDDEGKPRPYSFTPREGSQLGDIDPTSPEFEAVNAWGHKHGASEEALQELFSLAYEPLLDSIIDGNMDRETKLSIARYGSPEAAAEAASTVATWLADRLGEDLYPQIRKGITTDGAIKVFELLMQGESAGPSLIGKGGFEQKQGDTSQSILKMQLDNPKWREDPAMVDRARRYEVEEAARMDAERAKRPGAGPLTQMRADAARDGRTPTR